MRKIILNLHLYSALIAGLFLIVIALSGAVIPFENDLDRLFHPHLFKVQPGGTMLPVSEILNDLANAYPGQKFGAIRLPVRESDPYITSMKQTQIFIDSYNGQLVGTRPQRTIFSDIHDLHTSLMIRGAGQYIVMIATVFLPLLLISGIYLWWPLKTWSVKRGSSFRKSMFDLHASAGLYSAVFLMILGLTGLAIALDDWWTPRAFAMTHSSPPQRSFKSTTPTGPKKLSPDDAIAKAKAALPQATAFMLLMPPGPKSTYKILMRFPEDLTPGGRSWVDVDQYGGNIISVNSSRNPPLVTGIVTANRAIHTGDLWGYPTKFLASLSCLTLVFQTISGYYLWWKKLRLA